MSGSKSKSENESIRFQRHFLSRTRRRQRKGCCSVVGSLPLFNKSNPPLTLHSFHSHIPSFSVITHKQGAHFTLLLIPLYIHSLTRSHSFKSTQDKHSLFKSIQEHNNGRTVLLVLIAARLLRDSTGLVSSTRQETDLKAPCRRCSHFYFYLFYCRRVLRSQQTQLCYPSMRPLPPTQSQVW